MIFLLGYFKYIIKSKTSIYWVLTLFNPSNPFLHLNLYRLDPRLRLQVIDFIETRKKKVRKNFILCITTSGLSFFLLQKILDPDLDLHLLLK